jgi:hypothetical protein
LTKPASLVTIDIGINYEPNPEADSTLPSLGVALKQATGLLLKPQKVPV